MLAQCMTGSESLVRRCLSVHVPRTLRKGPKSKHGAPSQKVVHIWWRTNLIYFNKATKTNNSFYSTKRESYTSHRTQRNYILVGTLQFHRARTPKRKTTTKNTRTHRTAKIFSRPVTKVTVVPCFPMRPVPQIRWELLDVKVVNRHPKSPLKGGIGICHSMTLYT